jgi:hypothetical protein
MPIELPVLDNRRYQDLVDETLARISIHNPEWTNFNRSDPGVTLIELFAFLTETLLYRANQIPERNRLKFLSLLGVPLQSASSARGIVAFHNSRGPLRTLTLPQAVEVRAGEVPFRTEHALDVLPIEAQPFFKRALTAAEQSERLVAYYRQLYSSYAWAPQDADVQLYETTPLAAAGSEGLNLGATVGNSLWVALLLRDGDVGKVEQVREAMAGKTLSLGVVPAPAAGTRRLRPGGAADTPPGSLLTYELPSLPPGGQLPAPPSPRVPAYSALAERSSVDVLTEPGIVQLTLPAAPSLALWTNLAPHEAGVGDFPPALDDTALNDRLITWIRIRSTAAVQANILWVGINAATVTQRTRIANEALPNGTGEPDQIVTLSHPPVLPGSVSLRVTPTTGPTTTWDEIADLALAGPEVPTPDLRAAPGVTALPNQRINVYTLDAEAGAIRFGDGQRGRRPPAGAVLRADYDNSVGAAGNVGPDTIVSGPALPAGLKVTNPVRTWGGAAAETVAVGEKHISRYLLHRDRLVSAADFETITLRTPGVDIGRVEVLPAYHPDLSPNEPGDAPGVVTLMLIPRYDPVQPDAPLPDSLFLNTVCTWLDTRRLVTTELLLRGPVYVPLYVSVGLEVVAGYSLAGVREAVKAALRRFLAPLPPDQPAPLPGLLALTTPQEAAAARGWPLRKPVVEMELLAEASRVTGVAYVHKVLLGGATGEPLTRLDLRGLELPRLLKVEVSASEPVPLDSLRGQAAPGATPPLMPVPVIPEQCR